MDSPINNWSTFDMSLDDPMFGLAEPCGLANIMQDTAGPQHDIYVPQPSSSYKPELFDESETGGLVFFADSTPSQPTIEELKFPPPGLASSPPPEEQLMLPLSPVLGRLSPNLFGELDGALGRLTPSFNMGLDLDFNFNTDLDFNFNTDLKFPVSPMGLDLDLDYAMSPPPITVSDPTQAGTMSPMPMLPQIPVPGPVIVCVEDPHRDMLGTTTPLRPPQITIPKTRKTHKTHKTFKKRGTKRKASASVIEEDSSSEWGPEDHDQDDPDEYEADEENSLASSLSPVDRKPSKPRSKKFKKTQGKSDPKRLPWCMLHAWYMLHAWCRLPISSSSDLAILSGSSSSSETKNPGTVFRTFGLYPDVLSSPAAVGVLDIDQCQPAFVSKIKQFAQSQLNKVATGALDFGRNVVISSFQAYRPEYKLAATLPNLFFMHILCSSNVMETRHGKVSVFPVTVYTNKTGLQQKQGGFPCLVIHRAHFKTLMWRIYSTLRKLVGNHTLTEHISQLACPYDLDQDDCLNTVTGFEPYTTLRQKTDGGYLLLPAHWMLVMKSFFVGGHQELRDIGEIFRSVYHRLPGMEGKFDEEFRPIWLGDERSANVSYMVKAPEQAHTFGMARCRAVDGQVRVGRNGVHWRLPKMGSTKTGLADYDTLSFAYGVQCWVEQLECLNTCYTFFTGQIVMQPTHQMGLFVLDTLKPVKDRRLCLVDGILNDEDSGKVSTRIRTQRYRIGRKYGKAFLPNYFGNTSSVCRRDKSSSQAAAATSVSLPPQVGSVSLPPPLSPPTMSGPTIIPSLW